LDNARLLRLTELLSNFFEVFEIDHRGWIRIMRITEDGTRLEMGGILKSIAAMGTKCVLKRYVPMF
jgi:hypothetical protein